MTTEEWTSESNHTFEYLIRRTELHLPNPLILWECTLLSVAVLSLIFLPLAQNIAATWVSVEELPPISIYPAQQTESAIGESFEAITPWESFGAIPPGKFFEAEIERAMWESFGAAIETRMRPATEESVRDLFKARSKAELEESGLFKSGWRSGCIADDRQCVICLEEMKKRRSALRMPCSHSFHEDCLVEWLNYNHVCPLCRYELPSQH